MRVITYFLHMNHGSLFSEMPFYFVENRRINVTQHGFWVHFCVFMDRQWETRGKTREGFEVGVMRRSGCICVFSGRDLMCAACYNESECTLCTAAEGVDPERKTYWKFGVETTGEDAVFHT